MPRPAPTAAPFTAAMVTFGISASSRDSSCPIRCRSTRCSKVRASRAAEPIAETSPPAQKARPTPVTSTAPTSGSSAQRRRRSEERRVGKERRCRGAAYLLSTIDRVPDDVYRHVLLGYVLVANNPL